MTAFNLTTRMIDQKFLLAHAGEASDILIFLFGQLKAVSEFYPEFHAWLANRVLPGLYSGERKMLLEYIQGELAGIAIIKESAEEKKLCCIRVLPKFQGSGIGVRLMKRCFEALDTQNPLVTVSEENIYMFNRLFNYFGFELGGTYKDIYRPEKTEYSFNGLLYVPK